MNQFITKKTNKMKQETLNNLRELYDAITRTIQQYNDKQTISQSEYNYILKTFNNQANQIINQHIKQ